MLYVPCNVNGYDVAMFVDTGAQMSVMSDLMAENLGLSRYIDTGMRGIAVGVGAAKITGRIWNVPVQLKLVDESRPVKLAK